MNKTHETCFFLDITLHKTEEVFVTNILACILNFVFSLITCVGNFIILFAIRKTQDLRQSPSFILLGCLAASDLLVGLICQPFFVAFKIAELKENFSSYCTLRMLQFVFGWITSGVSLLTLDAVSIDRLLALTVHLRYNTIVTVRRVFQGVFVLWIFSVTVVMLRFWMVIRWIFLMVAIFLVTVIAITLSTFKIFLIVRRHQRHINNQNAAVSHLQTNTVNVLKCRKSAVTVVYLYGLFIIFYFPYCVTMIIHKLTGYTTTVKIAYDYVTTAVYINSFLNPLVYCWRIREIRRAVKNTLRRFWQD